MSDLKSHLNMFSNFRSIVYLRRICILLWETLGFKANLNAVMHILVGLI